MTKPSSFRYRCTIAQQIPFSIADKPHHGAKPSVGALTEGQEVWLEHELDVISAKESVRAFVDGIGVITVDPGSLSVDC